MASAEPRGSSPPYIPSDMGSDDDSLDLDSSDDDAGAVETENMLAELIARNKKPRPTFDDSSSDSGDSSDELDMLVSSDEEGGGTSEARQAAEEAEANEMVAELRKAAPRPEEPLAQPSLKRPRHSGGPSAAAAAAAAAPTGLPLPQQDLPRQPKLNKLAIVEMAPPRRSRPSPQQAPRQYDPRTSTEQEKAALARTLTQVLGTDLKCPLTLSSFVESGSLPVVVRTAGADYHVSAVGALSEMWPQFIEWFLLQETGSLVRCYGPMFHALRLYSQPEYREQAPALHDMPNFLLLTGDRISDRNVHDFASLYASAAALERGDGGREHLVSILLRMYGPLPRFRVHRPYHAESYVTDTDRALVTMLEHLLDLLLDLARRGRDTVAPVPWAGRLVDALFSDYQLAPLSFAAAAGGGAAGAPPLSLRDMLAENLPAVATTGATAGAAEARLIEALGPVFRHNRTLDTCVANLSGGGGGAVHLAADVGVMLDARDRFCFRKANRALEALHNEWIAYAHAQWLAEAGARGEPPLTREQQTYIYRQIAADDARIAAIQSHAFIVKHNLKTRRGTLPPALRGVVTPLADPENPPCAGCGVGMPRNAMGSWARWCRYARKHGVPEMIAMQCLPSQPVYCLTCSQSRTAFQCRMLLRGCSMEPYAKAAVDRAEAAEPAPPQVDGADPLPPLLDWNRISLTEAIHEYGATKTTATAGPDTERIRRRVQEALAEACWSVTGQIHSAAVAVRFSLPQHPGSDLDLERIVRKANLKEKAHLAKLNRVFLLPTGSPPGGSYAHTPWSLAAAIVGSKVFAYFCGKPTPKYISATREYCLSAFFTDSDSDSDDVADGDSGDEDAEPAIRMPELQVEVFLLKTNTTPEKVSKIITSHFQTLPALAMAKHKYDRRMLPRILADLDNPAAFGPPSMAVRNRGKLDSVAKMLAAHKDLSPSRKLRAHFDYQGHACVAHFNPFEYDANRLAGLAKVSAITILKTGDMRSF